MNKNRGFIIYYVNAVIWIELNSMNLLTSIKQHTPIVDLCALQ